MAPDALIANGALPSLSESVFPSRIWKEAASSPVVATVMTAVLAAEFSFTEPDWEPVTVRTVFVMVIVMTSVSAVVPSVAWTVRS